MPENEPTEEVVEKKDWQKGYDLDFLKRTALPFKLAVKPLCNGAFGCPNEQAVAAALAADEFIQVTDTSEAVYSKIKVGQSEDGTPLYRKTQNVEFPAQEGTAACIVKHLKVGSTIHDFAGRDFSLRKGDWKVECLAWEPANRGGQTAAKAIIASLLEKAVATKGKGLIEKGSTLYVKTHNDRKELVHMLEAHGFRLVTVQVSAGSDVMGIWGHGPGVDDALRRAPQITPPEARTLALMHEGQWLDDATITTILEEIEKVKDFFADHYSSYNKRHSWTAMALHGYDPNDPTFIIKPAEMSKKWKEENKERLDAKPGWTPLKDMMPQTVDVVSQMPGFLRDRIRIMRLAPGGELTRHADITDRDAGVADGKLTRIHVPLQTSPGCRFQSWDLLGNEKTGHMPRGHMCYLDQRKPHACKNDSESERLHLVVDVQSNDDIRARLEQGWELP